MGTLVDRIGPSRGYFIALALCLLASATNPVSFLNAKDGAKVGEPSFEVTSALGRKLYALPDDESVTAARKRLVGDPKNVALVLALSKAEAGRRQYKEAVATCTKGLLTAPKDADLYV